MITPDPSDTMSLGVPFMKGYYITHDLESVSFSIVPQAGSRKAKGVFSLPPENQAPRDTMDLLWLWISLGGVGAIVISVSVWLIVRYYKKQKEKQSQLSKEELQEWNWNEGALINGASRKASITILKDQKSFTDSQAHQITQVLT